MTLLDLVALLVPLPLASLLQTKASQRDTKQSDERECVKVGGGQMWETLFSMLIASTPGGLESRLACEVDLSETAGADGVKQSTQHSSRIGKRSDPHREKGKTVEGEFTSVDSLNSSSSAFSAEVTGDSKVLGGINARVECALCTRSFYCLVI